MRFEVAPLSGGFMLTSIIGFLFAVMFLKNYSLSWAIVIAVVSFVMFIASMISMTKAPIEDELAIDEHYIERKERVKKLTKHEYEEYLKNEKKKKSLKKPKKKTAKKKVMKHKIVLGKKKNKR